MEVIPEAEQPGEWQTAIDCLVDLLMHARIGMLRALKGAIRSPRAAQKHPPKQRLLNHRTFDQGQACLSNQFSAVENRAKNRTPKKYERPRAALIDRRYK